MFAAGATATLAMAPTHLWPVLLISLPVLFWAVDTCRTSLPSDRWRDLKTAAFRGWAFGFGYHFAGLYWIGSAFLVQPERFALQMPFAIAGLTAALGLFLGLAGALHRFAAPHLKGFWSRIVLFALAITLAEWLRGHILTGFPWNTLGYAITMPLPMMQWASVFGLTIMTAFTVVMMTVPLAALSERRGEHAVSAVKPVRAIISVTLLPLAGIAIFGLWRLGAHPIAYVENVGLRLVQPSIPQRDKFDASKAVAIFERHLSLSAAPARPTEGAGGQSVPQITHIFWPEVAAPFFMQRQPAIRQQLDRTIPDGAHLITGTFRAEPTPEAAGRPRTYRIYNSALVYDGQGELIHSYDKIHLVPFGEYLPAQGLLNALGFENLTRTRGGFTPGRSPRQLLQVPGLPPLAMLICYETIFPDEIADGAARPGLLVNLTNDAWFGNTSGPYQHLHQSRLRAVEQGVAMVRSANNGISAIIGPLGRYVDRLPLDAQRVLDGRLPTSAAPTIYSINGRTLEIILSLIAILFLFVSHRTKSHSAGADR